MMPHIIDLFFFFLSSLYEFVCVCVAHMLSRILCFPQTCPRQRMFNGTYPSTPFINHYDTMEDIKRRQHRIKWKVKGKSHRETNRHKHLFFFITTAVITCLSAVVIVMKNRNI